MVNTVSLLLVIVGSCIGAGGIFFLKQAAVNSSLFQLWRKSLFWGGFGFTAISTMMYLLALRQEKLSVLYPFVSTTYIWTTTLAVLFLHERLNRGKILSLAGIILGLLLVGMGSTIP